MTSWIASIVMFTSPPNAPLASKYVPFVVAQSGVPAEEKIEDGAMRELREESGFRADKLELLGSYLKNNRRTTGKFYVFLGTNLVEDPLPADEIEEIESFWFSEDEIENMISKGDIINGHVLTAWTLYKVNSQK